MLKLLLFFLVFHVSYSLNDSFLIDSYTEQIQNALTEILIIEPDPETFERTYENFAKLLDKEKFVAYYLSAEALNYDEFLYLLLMERKRIVKVEVLSTYRYTRSLIDEFETDIIQSVVTLKVHSLMNYTMTYTYNMKFDLRKHNSIKVLKIFVRYGEQVDAQSSWTPQYLETPTDSAKKFVEDICSDVTFSLDTYMIDEDKRDLFFTDNFLAFIDTNFLYFYDLDMFMKFMKRFNEKYEIQSRNNEYMIVTKDNDHMVFKTRVPFKYDDVIEYWFFEIETVYTYKGWKISKMFVGHQYYTNDVFKNRAGKELLEELKSEVNQTVRNSDYIEINETLLENAKIKICRLPDLYFEDLETFKIKYEESIKNVYIYSKFEFKEYCFLSLYVYNSDLFDNYLDIRFVANYNSRYNVLKIEEVTIRPRLLKPSNFENIKYKWITMDTKPIVIGGYDEYETSADQSELSS